MPQNHVWLIAGLLYRAVSTKSPAARTRYRHAFGLRVVSISLWENVGNNRTGFTKSNVQSNIRTFSHNQVRLQIPTCFTYSTRSFSTTGTGGWMSFGLINAGNPCYRSWWTMSLLKSTQISKIPMQVAHKLVGATASVQFLFQSRQSSEAYASNYCTRSAEYKHYRSKTWVSL